MTLRRWEKENHAFKKIYLYVRLRALAVHIAVVHSRMMLTNEGNFPLILILFPFHLLQAIIVINGLRTRYPCSRQPAAAAAAAAIGAAE